MSAPYIHYEINILSRSRKVDLVSFYFSFSFSFYFQFIFLFLFLELRVKVKPANTRRKVWKDNIIQCIQHILALRHTYGSLE